MNNDGIKITGIFELNISKIINNRKTIVGKYIDKNLVVNLGKEKICKFLTMNGVDEYIYFISFGTSNTPAHIDDTTITNEYANTLLNYTHPTINSVKYNFLLDTFEANGMTITEYGLKTRDGVLFARKVYTAIEKTPDMTFDGSWTLTIN